MKNIVVTIPIYKEQPNEYELVSFKQCLDILNRYRISLVVPEGLDFSLYDKYLINNRIDYSIERFSSSYFENINGYNRLMLSVEFYSRFIDFDYLLIYQLDCFVFADELEKWSNYGYDYIGAPWIYVKKNKHYFHGVGNGGLSLRNPKALKLYLESKSVKMNVQGFWRLYDKYSFIKKIFRISKIFLTIFGYENSNKYYLKRIGFNEDYVFGFVSQFSQFKLNIPSEQIALKFAFDSYPNFLFEQNGNKLPFGCHAWYKYGDENLTFWKKYILKK